MTFVDKDIFVTQAICKVLEQAGVDLVLGMPGGDIMRVFDALYDYQSTIRTLLVREESLGAIMAEVYGRTTGRPAVVMAQGAWVLANAGMGTLEALTGGSPMVILTDLSDKVPYSHHSPTQTGTGHYGNWDAVQAFRGFMKEVMVAYDPAQAVQMTQLALKHAVSGCPGPVGVVCFGGALKGRVGPSSKLKLYKTPGYLVSDRRSADPMATAQAAQVLAAAKKPVIVSGGGVRVGQAARALTALAETLSAPVVTTSGGKGTFNESHPLAGGAFNEYGLDAAAKLLGESDVVLAVGTRLAPGDTIRQHPGLIDPKRQTLIQIDIEPRHVGWSFPVEHGLVGDAVAVLRDLGERLAGHKPAAGVDGAARVRAAAESEGFFDVAESASDEAPILPQRLIRDLREALPDDAIVACDAGENRIFMLHHYRTKAVGGFIQPSSTGGMGYAIPSALGLKLAFPDRPAVAICGDGGFAMTMNGLMSSLELKLPIVVLVLNNGMLGWVQHVQGNRQIASSLGDYDYAGIARAMGCEAVRLEKPADIVPTVRKAVASGKTTVIDVIISRTESWEKVRCKLGL